MNPNFSKSSLLLIFLTIYLVVFIVYVSYKLRKGQSNINLLSQIVCKYPKYNPFDSEEIPYVKKRLKISCPLVGPDFVTANLSTLNYGNMEIINYKKLDCYYEDKLNKWVLLDPPLYLDRQFVKVKCMHGGKIVYMDYKTLVPPIKRKLFAAKNKFNVLVLGIGGVSRMAFHRHMRTTYGILKYLKAMEFTKMNALGLTALDNLMPMAKGCMSNKCSKKNIFIWDEFKNMGFVTVFAEDSINASTFKNIKSPLNVDYEWTLNNDLELLYGSNWADKHPLCIRNEKNHKMLLQYAKSVFSRVNGDAPTFAWIFTNAARRGEDTLAALDDDYSEFLLDFETSGYLANTVIFFVSDHGLNVGPLFEIYRGFVEALLPFGFILTPRSLIPNLTKTHNEILTAYDIHYNLKKLLKKDNFLNFPKYQSCAEANISDEFCGCERYEFRIDLPIAVEVTNNMIDHLNYRLMGTDCKTLSLDVISHVRYVHSNQVLIVAFRTKPGAGYFLGYGNFLDGTYIGIRKIIQLTNF